MADEFLLIRKLEGIARLHDTDRRLLSELPIQVRDFDRRQDIVREGEHSTSSVLVLEGFTCRCKILADGSRRILAFHVPGDVPDLQSLYLKRMDHNLSTVSPCRLAFIRHDDLHATLARSDHLIPLLWRMTLIDASIHREWIMRVGQRSARERLAHLLCELILRLEVMGLAPEGRCVLPVTQSEMADALGLTIVSVNRMLSRLRADGLIGVDRNTVTVLNWDGLTRVANFDPAYLHLTNAHVPALV